MTDHELMQTLEPYKTLHSCIQQVITALRERLAQPESAPGYCKHCKQYTIEESLPADQAQQPEQEPVAVLVEGEPYSIDEIDWESLRAQGHTVQPLYTTPQPRQWQGLTPLEIQAIYVAHHNIDGERTSAGWKYELALLKAEREKNA